MMMENPGRSAAPQLVVKIIGGKQIKQFIYPNRTEAAVKGNEGTSAALRASEKEVTRTSAQKLERLHHPKRTENTIPHTTLTQDIGQTFFSRVTHGFNHMVQVPDRVCVTAPSGDRSLSYIHLRRPADQILKPSLTELKGELVHPQSQILQAVLEELQGWKVHTLELGKIEEDLVGLDTSHTGTVHQSELTYLFLRWQVPLRLPTLASLLHTFSSSAHPEQVHYKELLQFIDKLPQNQELQSTEVEIWRASPETGDGSDVGSLWSEGKLMPADPGELETWNQRFQKMESALRLCDSQSTGYMEKEQARRLIQNYSQIFELNLSPLLINEIMGRARLHGRVHLDTALRLLKDH